MKRRLIIALALPVQFIFVRIMAHYPDTIEKLYSLKLYKAFAGLEQALFGWLPFSIGDLLYIVLGILAIRWLVKAIKARFKPFKLYILQVLSTFSIIYFLFHLLWGMNYYRQPLHQTLGIKTTYNTEDLIQLTEKLVERTNSLQLQLASSKTEQVNFPLSEKEAVILSKQIYDNLYIRYSYLKFNLNQSKTSLFSVPLSYMGFSGYLNPLTNEAQFNGKIPMFSRLTTITHEMGHQLGFAKENEANFMAALATINHPNPYFNYAGHAFALQYCLSDLNRRDPKKAKALIKKLHPGVLKNYKEVNTFWEAHQNPLEPAFKLFYDNFLKANNQPDGMKSYSYVVALLVNYYQGENEL